MSTPTATAEIGSLEQLYRLLPDLNYQPLWTLKGALTPEPVTQMVPYLWRYVEARELIERAGELISAHDAERRVLAFRNPGTGRHELARTTDTLWAAVQLVLPGEVAPAHRHTPAALRYIIEGEGAYTTVDGLRCPMERGDLVLTPNWAWHEHGHAGRGPMIWLDGLDIPMVHTMHLVFTEPGPGPSEPLDAPERTLVYKLADAERELSELGDGDANPYDALIHEYRDPANGGPVLPTLSAYLQLLRPGVHTRPHRHTASAVYHVVRGSGSSTIGGRRFDWTQGDTFAVPTWAQHEHANPGSSEALLFSFSDAPALERLGLLREQG